MLIWKSILKAGVAGGLVGTILQAIAQATNPSLGAIVDSALAGAVILLITMIIKQGNQLAALRAYAQGNKDSIDKLDVESRTVDKRIGDRAHLTKNELTPLLVSVEERAQERLDELRDRVARLEVRLEQFLEKK